VSTVQARNGRKGATILRIDLSEFENMKSRNQYYKVLPRGQEPISMK